jgi:hypothetical protein
MDTNKFQKKVLKLHKMIEANKLEKAAAGAAKLSGDDLTDRQRVDLLSFQIKMIRLAKKEEEAQKLLTTQRELVGKMAPYLAEALHMAHDGQFDDSIPRFKGALQRDDLADDSPVLSPLFPSARHIVHAHLLFSLDERACMKGTNRPTGFSGKEDRRNVLKFWSLPEAYYYMDIKTCPRCNQHVMASRQGEPTGAMLFHMKCSNCGHDWKRVFAVVPPEQRPPV